MTDKEKIIAEIERLMNWKPKVLPSGMRQRDVLNIRKGVLLTLKDFINSLPEGEQSEEFEDLEDSIIEFLGHVPENDPDHSETLYTYEQMQEIARHFANWQKEQMMKSAIDGTVGEGNPAYPQCGEHLPTIAYSDMMQLPKDFKFGEKIKIIIIKDSNENTKN